MSKYEDFIIKTAISLRQYDESATNEIMTVYSYNRQVEAGVYLRDNPDLADFRAKERYDRVIKKIIESNPREYLIQDYKTMNSPMVLEYVLEILKSIFGPSLQILEAYEEFINSIVISGEQCPMNGFCYEFKNLKDNSTKHMVVIPTISSVSSIVCLIHEFIHFYFHKNNILYKKAYYGEVLSILFEKIAIDMVERDILDTNFLRKVENTRLEGIKYHYVDKIAEMRLFEASIHASETDKAFMQQLFIDYKNHGEMLSQSYGLGYIYAESLFVLYKTDPNAFRKKMIEIFSKQISLQDTLDYFNISTSNKDVFERAKEKIRLATKK